jgi:hypothetical protein
MVVIYHWNTPLPKVRKGLDGYSLEPRQSAKDIHKVAKWHNDSHWGRYSGDAGTINSKA